MTEPTDDELDELRQANSGRLNFVTFREFRVIARAVLAKWGSQPAVAGEPLTDEQIRAMLNKHPPEDVCGWSYRMGINDAELHHGIKIGGQHGTE